MQPLILVLLLVFGGYASASELVPRGAFDDNAPLQCFQVQSPVLAGGSAAVGDRVIISEAKPHVDMVDSCNVTLIEYSFGNSYGHPFVGR